MYSCIRDINFSLKEHALRLNATIPIVPNSVPRAVIFLIRMDKWIIETRRSKPKDMIASFCPWCGEKYPQSSDMEPEA